MRNYVNQKESEEAKKRLRNERIKRDNFKKFIIDLKNKREINWETPYAEFIKKFKRNENYTNLIAI